MAEKTIEVVFDCGNAGVVTWKLPARNFDSRVSVDDIRELNTELWEQTVAGFFTFLIGTTLSGAANTLAVKADLRTALRDVAVRAKKRLQN
jgi:hypothetical protein